MADKTRHILICGGTSRAGLDAARLLTQDGFKCIVAGRHPPEGGEDLIFEAVDFADVASVNAFGSRLGIYNIDTCVFFQRSRSEDILESVQVAVAAPVAIVKALKKSLGANKGAVIFIGSIIGDKVGKEQTIAYHVSKGSLGPLARFMAVQYGSEGIRANVISLSTLKHSRNERGYAPGTVLDTITQRLIPIGRPTDVADVVETIKFLSSPAATAINGQVLHMDGGLGVLSQVSGAIQAMS
jgi:NAD(P)-dependent dehydrogenase (short-subunit alcohol dehydrogenase family)